jgi:uncharacterized RDD family membrane protein YckC
MEYKNTSFMRRLMALVTDVVISTAVYAVILMVTVNALDFTQPTKNLIDLITWLITVLLLANIISVVYVVYFVSKFGGTPGKLLFGIRIIRDSSDENLDLKTALLRSTAGYSFSAAFFGLGFWRMLKNESRLTWHDELFGSRVVEKSSFVPGLLALLLLLAATTMIFAQSFGALYTKLQPIINNVQERQRQQLEENTVPQTMPETTTIDKSDFILDTF